MEKRKRLRGDLESEMMEVERRRQTGTEKRGKGENLAVLSLLKSETALKTIFFYVKQLISVAAYF